MAVPQEIDPVTSGSLKSLQFRTLKHNGWKMFIRKKLLIAVVVLLLMYIVVRYYPRFSNLNNEKKKSQGQSVSDRTETERDVKLGSSLALAVVVCGDRWKETFVLLKSALLFTKHHLHIYVFADPDLRDLFYKKLSEWQLVPNTNFSYDILPVEFPAGEFESDWRKLFKPCSSQRLFLPSLLKNVDSVLYMDTDTLFLGPLEQVWSHFKNMNSSQFAALAPEHEDPLAGWYNRFARHPYYKPLGVNTGVMLMNLTRMRKFEWERYLLPIYKKYKLKIPWGDQDIINIIFHFHPDKLYVYPCSYNYRADHCMYSSVCKEAEKKGVIVLHGSRGIFHTERYPPFRSMFKAMEEYSLGSDPYTDLYLKMDQYLDSGMDSNCGKLKEIFLHNIRKYVNGTKIR